MKNDKTLELYKQLWNNRSFLLSNENSGDILHLAIKTELYDELTHPRTRKQPTEKYFMAVKRILESSLEDSDQLLLIKEFTDVLEEIKKES